MPHYIVVSCSFPLCPAATCENKLGFDTLPLLLVPQHLVESQKEQTHHPLVEKSKIRKSQQVVDIVSSTLYSTILVTTRFQINELDVEATVLAMALHSPENLDMLAAMFLLPL
jgi:hypothetical protein